MVFWVFGMFDLVWIGCVYRVALFDCFVILLSVVPAIDECFGTVFGLICLADWVGLLGFA